MLYLEHIAFELASNTFCFINKLIQFKHVGGRGV
jgi:hypothetical protein